MTETNRREDFELGTDPVDVERRAQAGLVLSDSTLA